MSTVTVTDFVTSGRPNHPIQMGRVEVPAPVNANDVASKNYVDTAVAVVDNLVDGFITTHEVTEQAFIEDAGAVPPTLGLAATGITTPARLSVYCNTHDDVTTVTWASSGAIVEAGVPAATFTLAAIPAAYRPAAAMTVAHPHVLTGGGTPLTYDNGWVTLGADGVLTFTLSGVNTWVNDTAVLSGSISFAIPPPIV